MRIRPLLVVTALLSSLLGAVAAYFVLTVPNDIQAAALMRQARKQISAGENDQARQSLSRIIQQYPRTDAAAAATVALATIADSERHALMQSVNAQKKTTDAQQKQIADLAQKVETIASTPPPAPAAPVAKPAPAKKTTTKTHKRTRHRRRRR